MSNREPYLHNYDARAASTWSAATGGVAVALDALMRERGGVWIAHGAGSADRAVVDASRQGARAAREPVVPAAPALARGAASSPRTTAASPTRGCGRCAIWSTSGRSSAREDWAAYQAVNAQFAAAIDEELTTDDTPVFIQDYHLALVAPRLRERRPPARTALFWHIPWPYPDRLRICPWRRELLAGPARQRPARVSARARSPQLRRSRWRTSSTPRSKPTARASGSTADRRTVVSVPIGVDYDRIQAVGERRALALEQQRLIELFGLRRRILGLGVDRLDYTKGIPERLAALDRVLTRRPDLRGQLTFVQIGVPSRSELESYSAIESEIDRQVAELNARHAVAGRPPPVYYHKARARTCRASSRSTGWRTSASSARCTTA